MKLYFNRNFSGYNWFEINDVTNRQDKLYYTVKENSIHSPDSLFEKARRTTEYQTISSLTLYGSYDAVFLKDGDGYVLAIKGIKEERTDEMGRGLNMSVIFVGDDKEFSLLHKMLLYFISFKEKFCKEFTELFSNSIDSIEFDKKSFVSLLDNIATYRIVERAHKVSSINRASNVYAIISEFSDEKIAEELHLLGFSRVKYSLKSITKALLSEPSAELVSVTNDADDNAKKSVTSRVLDTEQSDTIFKTLSTKIIFRKYTVSIYTIIITCVTIGFILGAIMCKK